MPVRTMHPETRTPSHPLLPHLLQRLESLALLGLAAAAYITLGGTWQLALLLILAPDLGMVGYAFGPRIGAMTYNTAHSYVLPALLALSGLLAATPFLLLVAILWFAHIAVDRALGYGLKHASGFKDTHLGRLR